MEGRRYAYSSCRPYLLAAGTTRLSNMKPWMLLITGLLLLLKSNTVA